MAARRKADSRMIYLEANDTIVHLQGLAVCGKSLTNVILDHKNIPPIKSGRKIVLLVIVFVVLVLKMPGSAIHIENLAVLNQHLVEVLLNRILLRHSQIPPFYIGRNARCEICLYLTCKGYGIGIALKRGYYSILTARKIVV